MEVDTLLSQPGPTRAGPTRAGPTRAGPSLAGPSRPGPSLPGPSRAVPLVPAVHRPVAAAPDERHPPLLVTSAQLLPKGWRQTLPLEQQNWVGQALFTSGPGKQPVLTSKLRLWWAPPGARLLYTQIPSAQAFFHCRFFLWAPYKMWAYKLACPNCGRQLTGAGLYRTVRRVLDIDGWYYMGTEYLECGGSCKRKYAAWAQDIVGQLDLAHQALFPAVLTYKLSCDKRVVGMMKARTLGNSASRLRAALVEQHTKDWLVRTLRYLSVHEQLHVPGVPPRLVTVPPMQAVPNVPWLISVYAREALGRLEETKARVTSVFGDILKMDSTKKMTKKLAGEAAGTAAWVSNVGNEHGQVLMSVLTESEGDGLLPMAAGLMRRYSAAGKAPPRVLYVDRDCCSTVGRCKTAAMFGEWEQLVVRLDVWHLMRRFARGVTTDSHPLYGVFMSRLSFAIFEWDGGDVTRLQEAKQSRQDPTSRELARHCRRRTRGEEETARLIQELLDTMWEATDNMGVPLIDRPKMEDIWSTQRRHLRCIQDPPGVELYAKKGELTRGGVVLPVYRCARGSTSLESFHLHLCRFIPGTSANALHFQVYLLEGLVRWNEDRARAAVAGEPRRSTARCYSAQLLSGVRRLSQKFMGKTLVENFTQPGEYTGELIGVEYLYSQTGDGALREAMARDPDVADGMEEEWDDDEEEEDEDEEEEDDDEGFQEELPGIHAILRDTPHRPAVVVVVEEEEEEEDVLGPDGHGGYQHAVHLAQALVELREHLYVTQEQVRQIGGLWQKLSDRDKAPISFPPRHQKRLTKGRFKTRSSKTTHTPGVDSVTRSYLGQGAGAAQFPDASRLMEAIFLELCSVHQEGRTLAGVRVNRWGAVRRDYSRIRESYYSSRELSRAAPIQLLEVNQRTLLLWHHKRSKRTMVDTVCQGMPGPSAQQTAAEPLPPARALLQEPLQPERPLALSLPEDASGQAVTRRGPLAPPLFNILAASAARAVASTSAVPTSASTSAARAAVASTSAAHAAVASTSAASAAPAPPAAVPRSTAWQRKVREEEQRRAREMGLPTKTRKRCEHFTCKRCGQPKTREYGHSRYRALHFCSRAEGRSVDDWLAEKRAEEQAEKERKQAEAAQNPSSQPPPSQRGRR